MILPLIAGAAFASLLVWIAHRRRGRGYVWYAVGLLVAALLYLMFAAAGGASTEWLGIELLGVVGFGAAAWQGYRRMPLLLAAGWAVHVAWDVLLHLNGAGAAFTPEWYPWLCVSFDLIVAAAVVYSLRKPAGAPA